MKIIRNVRNDNSQKSLQWEIAAAGDCAMKEKFEKEQKDNYIEDPMLDMPDMEDDEKFRQWLEETYIDEAEPRSLCLPDRSMRKTSISQKS